MSPTVRVRDGAGGGEGKAGSHFLTFPLPTAHDIEPSFSKRRTCSQASYYQRGIVSLYGDNLNLQKFVTTVVKVNIVDKMTKFISSDGKSNTKINSRI